MNLSTARVFVRDFSAAEAFYGSTLGLPVHARSPEAGWRVFGAGNCQLVVESVPADAPPEDQALVGRLTGLSFTVEDIGASYAELRARGVEFTGPPEVQPWGGTLATLQDPARNELQLVQPPS